MRRMTMLTLAALAACGDPPSPPPPMPHVAAAPVEPRQAVAVDAVEATTPAAVPAMSLRHVVFVRFVRPDVGADTLPFALANPLPFGYSAPDVPIFGSQAGVAPPSLGGPGPEMLPRLLPPDRRSVANSLGGGPGGGEGGAGGGGSLEGELNQQRWRSTRVRLDFVTANVPGDAQSTAELWYFPFLRYEVAKLQSAIDYRTIGLNPVLRDLLAQSKAQIEESLAALENGAIRPSEIPVAAGYGVPPIEVYRQGLEQQLRQIDAILMTNDLAAAAQLNHISDLEGLPEATEHQRHYETYLAAVNRAIADGDQSMLQHLARRIRAGEDVGATAEAWVDATRSTYCDCVARGLLSEPVLQERESRIPELMMRHVVCVRFEPRDVEAGRVLGILPSQRRAEGLPDFPYDIEDLERMPREQVERLVGQPIDDGGMTAAAPRLPRGPAPHVPSSSAGGDPGRTVAYLWTRFWFNIRESHDLYMEYTDFVEYSGPVLVQLIDRQPMGHRLFPIARDVITNRRIGLSPELRRRMERRLQQMKDQLAELEAGRDQLWGRDSVLGTGAPHEAATADFIDNLRGQAQSLEAMLAAGDPFVFMAEQAMAGYRNDLGRPGLDPEVRGILEAEVARGEAALETYRRDILPWSEAAPYEAPGPTPADFAAARLVAGGSPEGIADALEALDWVRTVDVRGIEIGDRLR